ncbi:MAG: helix-turn-helix domain-containing protein [Bacteroidia bacterium]
MSTQTIKIANMCCTRCILAVEQILKELGIKRIKVELGFAVISEIKNILESTLEIELKKSGFEVIKSEEEEISDKIKIAIHKIFSLPYADDLNDFNQREYLEQQTKMTYKKLSAVFSTVNKKTIEHYFITHKIETVKTMIDDTNHSFSEIAFRLGYKSLSHLSKQFKNLEGISMHDYKLNHTKSRIPIDKL